MENSVKKRDYNKCKQGDIKNEVEFDIDIDI